jgi:hypothetical protein
MIRAVEKQFVLYMTPDEKVSSHLVLTAPKGDGPFPVIITGNTAAIYPHLGALTASQTYYVTVDNTVFTDTNGALFAGIIDSNAWRFTTKPTGPANPTNLVVAATARGTLYWIGGQPKASNRTRLKYTARPLLIASMNCPLR